MKFRNTPNPYFATTNEADQFAIDTKGLPDGDYTLTCWQEVYQEKTQNITIKNGKTEKSIEFTY